MKNSALYFSEFECIGCQSYAKTASLQIYYLLLLFRVTELTARK